MEKKSCPECNIQFFGRKNQIYCSVECKNKSHNLKTRLIYISGKHGEAEIIKIQKKMSENSKMIESVAREYQCKTESQQLEIEKLRELFNSLHRDYQKIMDTVNRLKAQTVSALNKRIELEAHAKMLESIGHAASPLLSKISDALLKLKI